jgi:hypothetical protein
MKYLLGLTLILAIAGCSKPGLSTKSLPEGMRYEIGWIDPEIVLSDSAFTLIRATRIDSFVVDSPPADGIPSMMFVVAEPGCNVTANLLTSDGVLVAPLILEYLPFGCYKLTLNPGLKRSRELPAGKYILWAEVCGETISSTAELK